MLRQDNVRPQPHAPTRADMPTPSKEPDRRGLPDVRHVMLRPSFVRLPRKPA